MWIFIAVIIAIGLVGLAWFLNSRGVSLKWWEWVIGIVGILLLLFAIQNAIGAFDEFEPTAGRTYLLALGIPALVLIVLSVALVFFRRRDKTT